MAAAATTTTTSSAAASTAAQTPSRAGTGQYELIVDNRERALISALEIARRRYVAAQRMKKTAPAGGPQLFSRFSEVVLRDGGAEVRRPDGTPAYFFKFEVLSAIERRLEADEAAAAALLVMRPKYGDDDVFEEQTFTIEALAIGDVVVREKETGRILWVYERKTAADLAASVALRKTSQGDRMLALQDEGTSVEMMYVIPKAKRGFLDPCVEGAAFPGTRMPAATLRGSVRNGEVRDGFRATFVEDEMEAALHLIDRFNRIARFDAGTDKTQRRSHVSQQLDITKHAKAKRGNQTPLTRFADSLRAIPHVEGERALAIAQHFKTMGALARAIDVSALLDDSQLELSDIPYKEIKRILKGVFESVEGVGEKTAYAIFAFFHGLDGSVLPKNPPAAEGAAPAKRRKTAAASSASTGGGGGGDATK